MNLEDFVPISINVLIEGMLIDYSIYYMVDGSLVLLCKDVFLTKDILGKLRKTKGVQGGIYVQKKFQKALLKESAYLHSIEKDLRDDTGYNEIKNDVKNLLSIISQNNIVPMESISVVSEALTDKVQSLSSSLLMQCINSVRSVDEYLYTHSINVAMLNGLIGKWAKFDDDSIASLVKIGLLHDIGKLKIPDVILNKPSKLLTNEFEIIKTHPTFSYEMLKSSGVTSEVILQSVRHHHEKCNGKGYPDHLFMSEIPIFSRITAVSDVYDAMVSARVYKSAISPFKILSEFSDGGFANLDPLYVKLLLTHMPEELVHKFVFLSNGEKAEVVYVNPNDYAYPIVQSNGNIFVTNIDLYCDSMCTEKSPNPGRLL